MKIGLAEYIPQDVDYENQINYHFVWNRLMPELSRKQKAESRICKINNIIKVD
jgi:hypothetical protein